MQLISMKKVSIESKILLLKELGYDTDGIYVIYQNGMKLLDKYTDSDVTIDNMAIFPGSTIIIDDNPLSIASYLEEYGDVL